MNRIITQALILLVCSSACHKPGSHLQGITLDSRYTQIKNFETVAECRGPKGTYTTKVESDTNRNCLFSQFYDYNNTPFHALLTSDTTGYIVNDKKNILDTLPQEVIEMVKSHDFHRLLTKPGQFFENITFTKKLEPQLELYQAKDGLGNPAKLYYNPSSQLISKVELLNPLDTTQFIEIINQKWMDSAYGKMVKELEIIQARKDTFHFSFKSVKLNSNH